MIVLAELVNATRKKVREAVLNRDADYIKQLIQSEKDAGGTYIDINVGTGRGDAQDEIDSMKWAVGLAKEVSPDIALSIDSADNDVLKAGLEECPEGTTHFVNSVTAESERLIPVLELVKEYDTNVVALAMSDDGIQVEVDKRVEAAAMIYEKADSMGIAPERMFFDPLVMPLGTDPRNPALTLETGMKIKAKFPGVGLSMGLSNVSHGLPQRKLLNRVFLTLAIQAGFDSAIIDPCDTDMMSTMAAAEALVGMDEFCMNYITYMRSLEA